MGQKQDSMTPAGLGEVKAGGEIGRRLRLTTEENFLVLDVDKVFLAPFRREQPPEGGSSVFSRFVGLGMLIDAAVLLARDSEDPRVLERKRHLVEEAIKTQSPEGYIGIYAPVDKGQQLFREYCFHEAAYLVLGLTEDFIYFREQRSLEAARKLADYMMANWPHRPQDFSFTTLGTAEAFMTLHKATGERRYLDFAADEEMGKRGRIKPGTLRDWEQGIPTPDGQDYGSHTYRTLERAGSQLRLNRLEPNEKLPRMARKMYALMTRPEHAGMVVTGEVGRSEGWHDDQDGAGDLGETCVTVYTLRLLQELMRLDNDLRYGDVMERAIYNGLFAAQEPEGRRLRYFTPFSGKREYFAYDHYCCPNNFRRGMGHLPENIYFSMRRGLAVNLYTASRAVLTLEDGVSVSIRQETDYPSSGVVEIALEVSQPTEFALRLRIPRWCKKYTVTINGSPAEKIVSVPGGIELHRAWKPGDRIRLEMPMSWRLVRGTDTQDGRAAVLRGPAVYCLSRYRNRLPTDLDFRELTLDPASLREAIEDDTLRPGGTACQVRAWSPGRKLELTPDLNLLLTEFPDPTGEEIYFKIPSIGATVDDELTERPAAE